MYRKVTLDSMRHLNGNLLAVVDVETTGKIPGKHDLIQICVLPLDSTIRPLKSVPPFHMDIIPRRPENVDLEACSVNKLQLADLMLRGMDADRAVDLFEQWFERLGLPDRRRISPLAQNWCFDRGFIIEWLGEKMFEYIFDGRYRDTMASALFANDRADFRSEPCPYPKVNLQYLANHLKIESRKAHDALSDCLTTAEVYRRQVMAFP